MASHNEVMAYLAGLLMVKVASLTSNDEHRKGKPKAYKYWNIRIEINMIDEPTINFINQTFKFGCLDYRNHTRTRITGSIVGDVATRMRLKLQRSFFRINSKKDKLKQIINHYVH